MNKYEVAKLRIGDRFTKAVFINNGKQLVVGANKPLSEGIIRKLLQLKISYLESEGNLIPAEAKEDKNTTDLILEQYNRLLDKRLELVAIHNETCEAVSEIYSAIKNDQSFDYHLLIPSLEKIIDLTAEYKNVVLFFSGLGESSSEHVLHSVHVTFYAIIIAQGLKYTREQLISLGLGVLLIDAGMLRLPAYIAHKESDLSESEFNLIKTHPLLGYRVLKELGNLPESSALVSLQHHERFNGDGYPTNKKGNDIHEYARIAAIADAYESQVESRSYRKKQFFYEAMKNMLAIGNKVFDPILLRLFISRFSIYPIGSLVELNDKSVGLVIGSVTGKPLRPVLKIIFNSSGVRIDDLQCVSLIEEQNLYIVKAMSEYDLGIDLYNVL